MEFREVKPSNRIQLELESDEPVLRNIRGIVLVVQDNTLILITDYGELVEVLEDRILSITSVNMPKQVSDVMTDMKSHYTEIYETEMRLKELRKKEPELTQRLYDANFLSRFNISGAKNRLDKSIDPALLLLHKDTLSFKVSFNATPDNQIELIVLVSNHIDYPNLDEVSDIEKLLRKHAPDERVLLEKCFPFATKPVEKDRDVIHEEDTMYSVRTLYRMVVDVTKDNFLDVREKIKQGLMKMKK